MKTVQPSTAAATVAATIRETERETTIETIPTKPQDKSSQHDKCHVSTIVCIFPTTVMGTDEFCTHQGTDASGKLYYPNRQSQSSPSLSAILPRSKSNRQSQDRSKPLSPLN